MIVFSERYYLFKTKIILPVFLLGLGLLVSTTILASCGTVSASFTPSQTVICGSGITSLSFTNTSTGTSSFSATYKWYLNGVQFDNTSGLAPPINSTISALGTYNYMLIAFDASIPCRDTSIVTVYIHLIPVAGFTFNNNNQCQGTTISFTNTSTGTAGYTNYSWNFGDGNTSTAANPTHVYSLGGTFNATLTTSNGAGCDNTFISTVTVLPKPVQNFTATPSPGCSPQTVTFANTTTGAFPANFYWNFGNGNTSASQNPAPQIYYQGIRTIMMVAENACGKDTMYKTIEVDTIPKVVMSVSSINGCSPLTETTTNSSTGGNLTYNWYVDGGLNSNSQTINPILTAPIGNTLATHTVRLEVSNQCGIDDTTVSIKVHPEVITTISPIFSIICAGANFAFAFTQSTKGDSLSYFWNFDNGNTSTSSTPPSLTFNNPGSYSPSVIATGFCGSDTSVATLSVYPIPDPPIVPGISICAGTTATLTATITGGTCEWFTVPVNGTLLSTGTTYTTGTLNATTTYYVQTKSFNCTSARIAVTVTVTPLPAEPTALGATICEGTTATLTATAPGGTYTWYDAATAGTLLNTGASYTTPILSSSKTYYVQTTISTCSSPRTAVTVTVKPTPAAPTAVAVSTCTGNPASLLATAPGGTYQWYNAAIAGTLLSTGASYTTPSLTIPTTYYVQTTVNGCPGPRTAVAVTINQYPLADIAADVNAGCAGLIVNFTNNSTLGGTYNWSFTGASPSGSILYTPTPVIFNTVGIQPVYMTVNVAGCIKKDTVFISIDPKPMPAFTTNPASGCSPLTTVLNNTSPVTLGDSYFWRFDNGNTSNAQNPSSQKYTTTGVDSVYTIKLIVTAINGCKDSITHLITAHPNPVALFTPNDDSVCANTTITFFNNSTGANGAQWSFGDAATSTSNNPSHAYPNPSNYTVRLIATTSFGCKDTLQQLIIVDSVPVAAFSATTECFGYSTKFTNASTGSIANCSWNFGDSSPLGTMINPNHVYAASGTYNVTLTVINAFGCSHSVTHPVVVNPVPVAAFIGTTACLGQATVFTDQTSGNPIGWSWNFNDGTPISIAHNPSHTFSTAGVHNVTLIASGGSGCADTLTNIITVNPVPTANFTSAPVCTNDTMLFNSTSLGTPDTYLWNFGNGFSDNSNNPSPKFIYTTQGTFNVTLTAGYSSTGCTNNIILPVTVFPITVPDFTSTSPCLNVLTSFNDNTTNTPTKWNWNFGDGTAHDSTQNPTHTYASPATYTVTLVTQNVFGCKDSITKTTVVHPLPIAAFGFDTVCANTAISFTDQSTSAVAWTWDFGDGTPLSISNSPTHLFFVNGTYNVTLIVANSFGCTDTISHSIIVNPNPVSSYAATTACHTYPTVFNDSSVSAASWKWNFGDATALDTNQSPTHIYTYPGNYNVSLVVTNVFGCTNTSTQTVTVLQQPQADFTFGGVCARQTVQFTDVTIGVSTTHWMWDFGDGSPISNSQNASHVYPLGGNYNVTLIVGNSAGCADTIVKPVVVNTVPTPLFTSNTVCLGTVTSFTDQSTDSVAISNWFYNFDDGNNSVSQNPDYVYTMPGLYHVTLTVTNIANCDSSFVLPVIVNTLPTAAFTVDTVCLGTPTMFTNSSTGTPTQWSWGFNDSSIVDTAQNPSHLYNFPRTYSVKLIAGNAFGCKDSVTHNALVYPNPIAQFSFDTVCAHSATTFVDQSTSASSWTWDFGDGSPVNSSNSPMHTFSSSGTYHVKLLVSNVYGCTDTVSHFILVNPNPVSDYTSTAACYSYPTSFTDNSTSAISWGWDFGDGTAIDTNHSPTHVYPDTGSYSVSLLVTNIFGCTDTSGQTISVLQQPHADFTFGSILCAQQVMQFTDASVGSLLVSHSWDFGDGTPISNLQNPSHIYTLDGNYNVTLVISNSSGCPDTISKTLIVYTVPSPLFTANVSCQGTATSFIDQSTDAVSFNNWFWDFNDGNNSVAQNPNYIFAAAGTYNVSLKVTNTNGCDSVFTLPITVNVFPTANYTVDTVCLGSPTTFTDVSAGVPTSWQWDFGDGNNSVSGPVTTHVYSSQGSFLTSLSVFSGNGCTDQAFKIVMVRSDILPGITANNTVCANEELTLNDNSVLNNGIVLSDTWDFGDGSLINNSLNTTHIYTSAGTYTITHVVVSNGGCSNTAHDTIVVNPLPTASFSISGACQNQPTDFTDNSTGGVTVWDWSFGDAGTSTVINPTHIYTTGGTYNAILIVNTIFGCTDTIIQSATINSQPIASFTSNLVCWGDTTVFNNISSTSSGTITGNWWSLDDGTGIISTQTNPHHLFVTQNDTFNVTLAIITSYGCVDTLTQQVFTHPIPEFNFTPSSTSGCDLFTTTFTDSSTVPGGAIVNWQWDYGDGNFGHFQNPVYTYSAPGIYLVSLTVTSSFGCLMSDTLSYPIVVYPQPVAAFLASPDETTIYTPDIYFTDESQGAMYWTWNMGDNGTSILQNPNHTYSDTGTFSITQIVTNQYGCNDTVQHPVHIAGTYSIFIPNAFSPNADGLNDVFLPKTVGLVEFKMMIFDRWGDKIFQSNTIDVGWDGRVENSAIIVPQDMYVYKIITTDIFKTSHSYIGEIMVVR